MSDMMKLHPVKYQVQPLDVELDDNHSVQKWLEQFSNQLIGNISLLAFADDGVIWGKIEDYGKLIIAHDSFPDISPKLNSETLQTAYLFSENGEVRLWRTGGVFHACLTIEGDGIEVEANDQDYILWGTQIDHIDNGFTLVSDGRQGLRHAVPLNLMEGASLTGRTLRLSIRNYFGEDSDGQVIVQCSRLMGIFNTTENKNE